MPVRNAALRHRRFDRSSTGLPLLAAAAAIALLCGCASLPDGTVYELPPMPNWNTRLDVLSDADDWYLGGRIGVRTADDGFNARFRHRQRAERFESTLAGPLGIGTIRLDGSRRRITLFDKDGQRLRLDDAERDLERLYGWTIPVDSLKYWALGIPDPSIAADITFDDDGRLASVSQRGWQVKVDRYRRFAGEWMPARITAESASTRVRLVVDDWAFYEPL